MFRRRRVYRLASLALGPMLNTGRSCQSSLPCWLRLAGALGQIRLVVLPISYRTRVIFSGAVWNLNRYCPLMSRLMLLYAK